MMRLLFGRSAVVVALASFGGLYACDSNSCTGVSCLPGVTITPEQPISESGNYEVDFNADGMKMTCTLQVPSSAPSKCTDSRAYVKQQSGQGITFMSVDGMYDTLSVTVKRDGKTIAEHTYSPLKYKNASDFTGAGCVSCPAAQVTLPSGGEEPDASSKPPPDASVAKKPDASVITAPDASAHGQIDAGADAR